ncbi:hypothetical protein IC229_31635 [Spirosoma sp. BT702]|uniref:Uncharacterized protein n=1 Tax=Spirosoma profusum TaxID=2771354 RepID=A0A927GA34_9BACT|nr:hypothetical protein [Spirosoma profusum]MBD2705216.1 hypothetical protein [Spirosoma profusum]
MKNLRQLLLIHACALLSNLCLGQQNFTNCSAAFLGNKMVVNEYTPTGKCSVPTTAIGELTVNTVNLSKTESKAVDRIPFSIAIRDKNTKTLVMYAREEFRQIPIERVLSKCRKGDSIVLITANEQYALPHNEILVH